MNRDHGLIKYHDDQWSELEVDENMVLPPRQVAVSATVLFLIDVCGEFITLSNLLKQPFDYLARTNIHP